MLMMGLRLAEGVEVERFERLGGRRSPGWESWLRWGFWRSRMDGCRRPLRGRVVLDGVLRRLLRVDAL
jgi:hypothetical protein